eukprot:360381-Chlamydomonas_euryale.AAC.5
MEACFGILFGRIWPRAALGDAHDFVNKNCAGRRESLDACMHGRTGRSKCMAGHTGVWTDGRSKCMAGHTAVWAEDHAAQSAGWCTHTRAFRPMRTNYM